MSNVQIIPIENRQQWLALRGLDVTASDIGACCGVSPHKTPLKLYAEKTGLIEPDHTVSVILRRGLWLEPSGLFALRETHPTWDVRKADVYLRDPELRIGATPDFVAEIPERPGLTAIQMKTVAASAFKKWRQDDGIPVVPLHYQLQTLTEAKLLGADHAMILAFVIGEYSLDLELLEVEINEDAWARIKGDVAQFWWHVENRVEPSVAPERDGPTLREMYRHDAGTRIDLSGRNDLPALLEERDQLQRAKKAAEARVAEIDTTITAALKLNSYGDLAGWNISWKAHERSAYSVAATTVRTLRITKKKGK